MTALSFPMAVLAGFLAASANDGAAVELRYQGSFTKAARDREPAGDPVKRFHIYCLATPRSNGGRDVAFFVEEQGGGSWPWPARFGKVATDSGNRPAKNPIRLLHEHKGTQYVLAVPFPYFEFAGRLTQDASWEAPRAAEFPNQRDSAPWRYKVVGTAKVGTRECWRVDATNNFGPQESLWIEKGSPLLVKAEKRIVIGRGDEHVLKMTLDSVTPVTDESLTRIGRPLEGLLQLQAALNRPADEKNPELNAAQLKTASAAVKSLEIAAEGTPFDRLVAAIVRDVNAQSRRSGDVGSLAKRFLGKPAPAISLKSLDHKAIPPQRLAGKVLLLHFWSYQGEPFPPEPYGQVGYLDYLYNRRKKLGLTVYGVAVDRRLSEPSQSAAVVRSIRKLQGFMNLSYPLALDDGTLLEKFGDPRRVGAKLPLWVLIDTKGTVVEYKVGNYEIKADEGLSRLDKAVSSLLRKKRASK